MIGYFPPPYPDELLYNIIARLHKAMGFRSQRAVGEDLFASSSATAVSDLPHRLGSLVMGLHESTGLSIDILIEKHTLWPYWAVFHSSERRVKTRIEMTSTGHPYLCLGLMASQSPWPRFLRYCQSCVEEDRRSATGETYWHRIHQIPGISICSRHGEPLQDSSVEFRHSSGRFAYISAESPDALRPQTTQRTFQQPKMVSVEMRIAQNAAWLLENPTCTKSGYELRERYLWELALRGDATWNGHLHAASLLHRFSERYSSEWLVSVGCGLSRKTRESWLERLVHKPQSPQATFRHLLLHDFLETSAETIICSENPGPFGSAPWPCLNQAASHYGDRTIETCKVSATGNGRSVSGTFSCSLCGMSYLRPGPDRTPEDRQRRDRIPVYGAIWDQMLRDLWSAPEISLRQISSRLGVDPRTAQLQSARLHLHQNRGTVCSRDGTGDRVVQEKAPRRSIDEYKAKWLMLCYQGPDVNRTQLRKLGPRYHALLRRYARGWLEEHSPPRQIPNQVRSRVDWTERDRAISKDLTVAAQGLFLVQPPVRVTRTAILCKARLSWVFGKLKWLPTTAARLASIEESRIDFACRRIRIIAGEWSRNDIPVPRWRLIRAANLRPDLLNCKKVVEAIAFALRSLNGGRT
jgi:hypothetical protein